MDVRLDDTDRAGVRLDAEKLWDALGKNERTAIRFGLFPHEQVKAAGYDPQTNHPKQKALNHAFVLALMDCAERDGGMRA